MARSPKEIVDVSVPMPTNPWGKDGAPPGLAIPAQDGKPAGAWQGKYVVYTYADGTQELRFFYEGSDPETANGVLVDRAMDPDVRKDWLESVEGPKPPARTPEQTRLEQSRVVQEDREELERQYNANHGGIYETHAERSAREQKAQQELRAQQDQERERKLDQINAENTARQAEIARGNLEVSRGQLELSREQSNKPSFLSQAGENNQYIVRFNPQTGQIEQAANPNYDAVKQEAEQMRSLLATQIQARQLTLQEAKQQYEQWFDSNVKTPLALSQEARDKAAEQRSALDAEERRRQFASSFGLQKAELGQRAGAAAMQAEQSLLPYRAGPTESAEMSSAINSLAAGGTLAGPSASAGINFTPGAFEFDAPDFKGIAKQAAAAAVKGLTDYKPLEQSYQTADYSGVPAVATGGAPTIPSGYGAFQGIIDDLKSKYNFGGQAAGG